MRWMLFATSIPAGGDLSMRELSLRLCWPWNPRSQPGLGQQGQFGYFWDGGGDLEVDGEAGSECLGCS